MAIDMASVYAKRFEKNPDMLRAAVMGQSPDPKLDSYTALNALRLIKESQMMAMAGQAQQPTSSPSIVAQNMAPNPMQQGLGAMVPGAMGQAPQGMPPQGMPPQQAPMPQPTMQAASGGLAGMYTPEEDYAEGGIVAFQSGGLNSGEGMVATAVADDPVTRLLAEAGVAEPVATDDTTGGSPAMRDEAFQNYLESRREIQGLKDEDFTPEEAKKYRQEYYDFSRANAGPDIYAPANKRLTERENARSKSKSQGEGLALLAAAGAILEGNTLARGASKAFPVFAKEMGEVQRADINEQRSIESMQFALADAQRKERMGDIRGAQAAMETARKAKSDANRFKLNKAVALGTLDSKALQSLRPAGRAAGVGADKEQPLDRVTAAMSDRLIEMRAKDPNDPQIAILKEKIAERKTILGMGKEGPTAAPRAAAALTAKQNAKVIDKMAIWETGGEARRAKIDGTIATARANAEAELRRQAMAGVFDTDSDETPSAAPAAAPKPAAGTAGNPIKLK
jgi:hypothetical protein